jgi:two-component system, chemotaxis family, chemotaxis protein CheY
MSHMIDKLSILVIDDNQHMVNIVRTIMRGFGAKEFLDARSAIEAYDIVKSEAVDLIITDYALEGMDGCDFSRLVRVGEDSPNHYVPIIMLSAYSERSRVEAARDAGVTEFCAKPVTAVELYRKVVSVINTPRPFIRTATYFGPDRRRRASEAYKGKERREALFGPKAPLLPGAKIPQLDPKRDQLALGKTN